MCASQERERESDANNTKFVSGWYDGSDYGTCVVDRKFNTLRIASLCLHDAQLSKVSLINLISISHICK